MTKNKRAKKSEKLVAKSSKNAPSEKEDFFVVFLILLIGIAPGLIYFSTEPKYNYDLNILYTRVSSIERFITNFEYPVINPDLHLGEFNVYYPFAFILTSLIALIVNNIFLGTALARIFISFFAALVFYKVCRYENIDVKTSLLLAFIFSFIPYHLGVLAGSLSWAATFIFVPPMAYFLYRCVNEHNQRFEVFLIFSSVLLILTSFAPFLYIVYFFLAYLLYQFIRKIPFNNNILLKLLIPFLFIIGISSFYTFLLLNINDSLAWSKILTQGSFSPSREFYIKSGIDPLSLLFKTENFTTFGIIPIALFIISFYIKIKHGFSRLDRYLLAMIALSLMVSIFPITVAYLPFIGNTEYGFRAIVIGAFALVLFSKDAIEVLKRKVSYSLLVLIIVSGMLLQISLTPDLLHTENYPYQKDIEDFYNHINAEEVTRINYRVGIDYPLCRNCIGFGAPENYYGNVRDQQTTTLWGYIDFAQRNPADIKTSGILGEKYVILKNEQVTQYLEKGYKLEKEGEKLALLKNPNSTSVLQFITEQDSSDLKVERRGSSFSTRFKAESDGVLLIKFAYHPLAEVLDNGKKAEIKETNYGIMYAELKSGSHEIVFRYRTYKYYYITVLSLVLLLFYYRKNIIP